MESIEAALGLGLVAVFFCLLIAIEILLKSVFNHLYTEDKKLHFSGKIKWLQENQDRFDKKDARRVQRTVTLKRVLFATGALMFLLYLIGNLNE